MTLTGAGLVPAKDPSQLLYPATNVLMARLPLPVQLLSIRPRSRHANCSTSAPTDSNPTLISGTGALEDHHISIGGAVDPTM